MAGKLDTAATHLRASRFIEAARECEAILTGNPDQPDALHFLGLAKWQIGGNAPEAIALIERAMQQTPGQSSMHHNLAAILASAGQLDNAEQHYRTAIQIKPDYAEAYFNLSGIIKLTTEDPALDGMKSLYAGNGLTDLDREFICYALSKAHDDIKSHEEAFHFALEGSRLKKQTFDMDTSEQGVQELKQTATASLLKPVTGRGNPSTAPIFIVGMPRSGTTLVEQILSRHSAVYAAGELPSVGSFHRAMRTMAQKERKYTGLNFGFLPLIPHELITSASDGLLQFVNNRAGSQFSRFTDKMPQNAFHLGLIAMLFPNARIIHVRRHPLDTCVSCFMQRFRDGQEFSDRLDWLGRYYRCYADVMDHWRKVLPLEMLDISYENLVADPQDGARKLIAFTGLDWQDACADPSGSDRDVRTASRWQVRQPIYKTSVDRWKRYEAYLGPLIEALGGHEWIKTNTAT